MPRAATRRGLSAQRLASIAARNLVRHRRRTVLTAASAAASAAALVFFLGFYRGTYDQMFYAAIIDYQTAHAQIQAPGLDPEDPEGWLGAESLLSGWEEAAAAARRGREVAGVAPRLEFPVFAGDGSERLPALLAGVDFAAEGGVSLFVERLVAGTVPAGRGQVLVGDELARLFTLAPGSSLLLQAVTSRGAPNIARVTVAGIYDTGFALLDASLVACALADAQELADAPGAANRIYVRLRSLGGLERAMPGLAAAAELAEAEARPWTSYAREAIDHARTEGIFYWIFLAILVFLACEAVTSTMRAAVRERVREIGAMRATGWSRREVFLLFALESATIGALGSAAGACVGGLLSGLLAAFPVDVSSLGSLIEYPFFSMTSSSRPGDFAAALALGTLAALAAGALPARSAARTNIAEALSSH